MSIITKIRALRAKAEDAAATEAEAEAAARMAADLMRKHDISEEAIANAGGQIDMAVDSDGWRVGRSVPTAVLYSACAVATFCEAKIVLGGNGTLIIMGREADREMAIFLLDLIHRAAEGEWQAWRKTRDLPKDRSFVMAARRGFMHGFAERMSHRLLAMHAERTAARSSTGTALAISRQNEIAQFMRDHGIETEPSRDTRKSTVYTPAISAGRAAADRTAINRPVNGRKADPIKSLN